MEAESRKSWREINKKESTEFLLKKKGEGGGQFFRKFHKFPGDSIRDFFDP